MRPGPLPAYGQPGDPSLAALLLLAAGAAALAAIALKPDLVVRCEPLTLRQRAAIQWVHWKRKPWR